MARKMAAVEWQSNEPSLPVTVPGWDSPVWLRTGTTDSWVFRQQILAGELELDFLPTQHRVIDGGANIGLASLVFAHRWPEAEIVAVELEAGNFAALRRNCADFPRIVPVHGAIWGSPGMVGVTGTEYGEVGFRVETVANVAAVPALTIDAIADLQGWDTIDLVKLDIEGAELDVLASAAGWIDRVTNVAIELHDRFQPGCQAAFDAVFVADRWQIRPHGEYLIASRR
jgi:FkbM family methyltransferase